MHWAFAQLCFRQTVQQRFQHEMATHVSLFPHTSQVSREHASLFGKQSYAARPRARTTTSIIRSGKFEGSFERSKRKCSWVTCWCSGNGNAVYPLTCFAAPWLVHAASRHCGEALVAAERQYWLSDRCVSWVSASGYWRKFFSNAD